MGTRSSCGKYVMVLYSAKILNTIRMYTLRRLRVAFVFISIKTFKFFHENDHVYIFLLISLTLK